MMDKQRKKLLPCAADHRLDEPAKLSLSMVASPQCPLPFRPPERVYSAKLLGSKTEIPVYAVNSNGKPKWEFRPGGDIRWLTFGPAGRVYISALVNMNFVADAPHDTAPPFRSQLYALRADGTQVWNSGTLGSPMHPYSFYFASAIGPDGTIYILGAAALALNPDGTRKWQAPVSGEILAVGEDGTLYIRGNQPGVRFCGSGVLSAVSPDGAEKWNLQPAGPFSVSLGKDGTVYLAESQAKAWCNAHAAAAESGSGGALEALTPAGVQKWSFSPGRKGGVAAAVEPRP